MLKSFIYFIQRVANLIDEVNELKQLNDQQVKDRVQIQRSIYSIKDLILASGEIQLQQWTGLYIYNIVLCSTHIL